MNHEDENNNLNSENEENNIPKNLQNDNNLNNKNEETDLINQKINSQNMYNGKNLKDEEKTSERIKQILENQKVILQSHIKINDGINNINEAQDQLHQIDIEEKKTSEAKSRLLGQNGENKSTPSVDNKTIDQISNLLSIKKRRRMIYIGAAIGIFLILFILIILIVIMNVQDDESTLSSNAAINDFIFNSNSTTEDLVGYLTYMNMCQSGISDDECMDTDAGRFFIRFQELYNYFYTNYKDKDGNGIQIDVILILETISYYRTDRDLLEELTTSKETDYPIYLDEDIATIYSNNEHSELTDLAMAMVEHAEEKGDLYTCSNSACTSCSVDEDVVVESDYYRISDDKYISYLKFGEVHENYSGNLKIYDVDIDPDSDSACIPSGRYYNPPSDERYVDSLSS